MVRDNGTPSQRSFARIVINVHDENDHHPEFISPSFESQVYETAALGTSVIRILAVDKDKGKNAQLHFSIASGNACYFSYFYRIISPLYISYRDKTRILKIHNFILLLVMFMNILSANLNDQQQ